MKHQHAMVTTHSVDYSERPLVDDKVATTPSSFNLPAGGDRSWSQEADWLQKLEQQEKKEIKELRKAEQLLKKLVEVGLPAAHQALELVDCYYARDTLVLYEAAIIELREKKAALEQSLTNISKQLGALMMREFNGLDVQPSTCDAYMHMLMYFTSAPRPLQGGLPNTMENP